MAEKLKQFKKEYEKIREKYELPSFRELNRDFEIEKLQEEETGMLVRKIRQTMTEKNAAYLRFAEMFMNPSNAPMFFLALAKNLNGEEKDIVEELYLKLGKFEIKSIELDNDYDEEKNAGFINDFYKEWQEIKKSFGVIMKALEEAWERKAEKEKKGYLG